MRPPTALSIADSDSSGGGGIQADLKTFTALGVYGTSAVTALTAQSTQGVAEVLPVPNAFLAAQVRAVHEDMQIDATRIGALADPEMAGMLATEIAADRPGFGHVVLDPVLAGARAGMAQDLAAALRESLLGQVDVLTTSLTEAAVLLGGSEATELEQVRAQALALRQLGPSVVIMKGSHLPQADQVVDVVVHPGGTDLLRGTRVPIRAVHGAGGTFSSAIAAQYARLAEFSRAGELDEVGGPGPEDDDFTVVSSAREFLASALANAVDWELSRHPETSRSPVNHLITLDRS